MYNRTLAHYQSMLIFYRRNYRAIIAFMYLLVFVAIVEFGIISYFVFIKPPPQYYAVHDDGSLSAIKPLTQPNFASSALAQWEK
jgi:hypothetical protein